MAPRRAEKNVPVATQRLCLAWRLYVYALHGYLTEVTFTAVWELLATGNPELRGYSSIWSLAVYSVCCVGMETTSSIMASKNVPLPARALAHTCCIYAWEFSAGFLLRTIGACPWNYKNFRYNFAGLVTLEYCPLWFVCGILFELVLRPIANELAWIDPKEMRTNVVQEYDAKADAVGKAEVSSKDD